MGKPGLLKAVMLLAIKVAVTVGLIAWLIHSEALEMGKLRVFLDSPRVLLVTCVAWFSMAVVLASWRWMVLLEIVGVRLATWRAAALQTMAQFFNGLVPGNVGGDFIKNQAVLGNQGAKLVVMVFLERILGLISLVWAGGLGLILSLPKVAQDQRLLPVAIAIVVLVAGSILGPWLMVAALRAAPEGALRSETSAGGIVGALRRWLGSAWDALQLIRKSKGAIFRGVFISFAMHLGNALYFLFLTRELGNPQASFAEVAMVFPLGMLTLILPISVSGLGVGHVMFNELFLVLGLEGGATIFNVFIVGHLAPCVLGAVPYLFMRGRPSPSESA